MATARPAKPTPPAADKITWPTVSCRMAPATFAALERDLHRLDLNRGTWARDELTKAAGRLRDRKR